MSEHRNRDGMRVCDTCLHVLRPTSRGRKCGCNTLSSADTFAYRGYLIRVNPLNGGAWVEKDGHLIANICEGADSLLSIVPDGRKMIDTLLEG